MTSTIVPLAGGFPQCETLGDDVGNSIHGMPVQRLLFLRLTRHLVLHLFSSDGCPIDGGMGGAVTYSIPLRPSLWLVGSGGYYRVPAPPPRAAAEFRVDLVKETQSGQSLRMGIEKKSGTGVEGVPAMVTFGGGF